MAHAEARRGPLVRRSAHVAAALWALGSLQFVLAMAVVQSRWTGSPAYSLRQDVISDLGNTACAPFPSGSATYVCSPAHAVFNGSAIALGLLVLVGVYLVRTAFPARRSAHLGLALLIVAGVGSIVVGLSPENVHLRVHDVGALLAFVGGNLALLVLALGMLRDTRWDGYRLYTLLSGAVGLVATVLYLDGTYVGLGPGGMERLIVAPLLLWLVVVAVHLLRVPALGRDAAGPRPPDALGGPSNP